MKEGQFPFVGAHKGSVRSQRWGVAAYDAWLLTDDGVPPCEPSRGVPRWKPHESQARTGCLSQARERGARRRSPPECRL